jgi:hypothetical protein
LYWPAFLSIAFDCPSLLFSKPVKVIDEIVYFFVCSLYFPEEFVTLVACCIADWCQAFIKLQHLTYHGNQIVVHLLLSGIVDVNAADGERLEELAIGRAEATSEGNAYAAKVVIE